MTADPVAFGVRLLHAPQSRVDLARPESQLPADAEAAGAAALAAQVVQGLHAHAEPRSQFGEGENGLERVMVTIGAGGLAQRIGVHTHEVHQAPRGPPKPAERNHRCIEAQAQSAGYVLTVHPELSVKDSGYRR